MASIVALTLLAGALIARLSVRHDHLHHQTNPGLAMVTGGAAGREQLVRPNAVPAPRVRPCTLFQRTLPTVKDFCCCVPRLAPFSSRPSVRPSARPSFLDLTWRWPRPRREPPLCSRPLASYFQMQSNSRLHDPARVEASSISEKRGEKGRSSEGQTHE
ncbi:hypothetical protein BKA80DRAFT_67984 [Phyllosticta citrichinensis]